MVRHAERLLGGLDVSDGLRLIGVGVSGLSLYTQPDLLDGLLDAPAAPGPADVEDFDRPDAGGSPEPRRRAGAASRSSSQSRRRRRARPAWRPGQDVEHAEHGRGWVQGSGVGRVTVRFEGPHTEVGRIRTFADDDPELTATDPPVWQPSGSEGERSGVGLPSSAASRANPSPRRVAPVAPGPPGAAPDPARAERGEHRGDEPDAPAGCRARRRRRARAG